MPQSTTRFAFVYGTLRRGEERDINLLDPEPQFIGCGSLDGALFDLGTYPGLRLGGAGQVEGEIYAITPALERKLDEIEAVWPEPNGEYVKREVTIRPHASESRELGHKVDSSLALACLVYEATPQALSGRPAIAGGDWVTYRLGLR
jgi:gamma-glutamylcyclotransferase (GGCT)/AIG2-like uncharacterized protein YtfP